jgi:O-antigen ligase
VRYFHIGIAVFVLLFPLHVLIPDSILPVRGLNVQTAFVLYFVLLGMLTGPRDDSTAIRWNPILVPLVGLIVVLALSAVRSGLSGGPSFGESFAALKGSFIYAALMPLVFHRVTDERDKRFILAAILLVSALTALHSQLSVFQKSGLGLNLMRHRAMSLIVDQPNMWGGYLAMFLFLFFGVLMYYPLSWRARLLVVAGSAIVGLNLVYTLSRGAWLAFAVTATLISLTKAPRLLVPIGAALLILTLRSPEIVVDRLNSIIEEGYDPALLTADTIEGQETALRIVQWRTFLPFLIQNPVFGVGFGEYERYDVFARSAHSSLIKIGIEQGLIGLFFYAWILGGAAVRSSRILKHSEQPLGKVLALGLLASTICLFLLDLTGTRFLTGNIMVFYWILAGITLNITIPQTAELGRTRNRHRFQSAPAVRQRSAAAVGDA